MADSLCWHSLVRPLACSRSLTAIKSLLCRPCAGCACSCLATSVELFMRSAGFVLAAQVTGKGPLGALGEHLSDPISKLPPAVQRLSFVAVPVQPVPMSSVYAASCMYSTGCCIKIVQFVTQKHFLKTAS